MGDAPGLEAKCDLQVDTPVGGTRSVWAVGDIIGLAEQGRTQVADRRGEIDFVESVPRGDGKGQTIAAIARTLIKTTAAPPSPAGTSAGAAKRAASTRSARSSGRRRFFYPAEAKGLAQPQTEAKARGAFSVIDGN